MLLATTNMPTVCMELDNNKQQLVLELYLKKGYKDPNNVQTINDRYHCQLLGIGWEENNNSHSVESHLFAPKESLTHYGFESICTEQIEREFNITIPKSLPNSFVERLKKDKTIALNNHLPVQIIVNLKGIYNNPDDTTDAPSYVNNQSTANNNIKAQMNALHKKTNESLDMAKNESTIDDLQQPQTNSKFKTYIIPAAGFTIAGIIAWLSYLHINNQLNAQLAHITDFIHSLISSKNS